jgi:hypothetical protein
VNFREAEHRVRRCIGEVAGEQQFQPARDRRSVGRADDRHRAISDRAVHALEQIVLHAELLVGHAFALLEVRAAAERALARARQDHAAIQRRVRFERAEYADDFLAHRRADRIRDFRTVQLDDQDLFVDFFERQRVERASQLRCKFQDVSSGVFASR